MLAEVAAGLIWRFVYDGDYGLVSAVGNGLGLHPPFVLADKFWVLPAIMVVIVWKYFGFHMMIYIAGAAVDPARGDRGGAARRRQARPDHSPHQDPDDLVVDRGVDVLRNRRGAAAVRRHHSADQWRPNNSTHTIVTFLYQFGVRRLKYGFGGAVSVILFVMCVGFAIVYRRALFPREEKA